jgi:hypothetical protein
MTKGLERIGKRVQAFSNKVAQCRATKDMDEIEDAYGRFHRAKDRYRYEAYKEPSLDPAELKALQKVFEENEFIEGVGRIRGIAEHVETGEVTLRDTHNRPYTITSESSAEAVFKGRVVNLPDKAGTFHRLDHIEYLTKADWHIKQAFQRAKDGSG